MVDLYKITPLALDSTLKCDGVFIPFVEDFVIRQFIGIQDKNDRDIYSGDIINFEISGIPHGPERDYIKNVEVWYNEKDAMFCFGKFKMNDGQDYWYSMCDRIDRKTIEIVGNIFENNKTGLEPLKFASERPTEDIALDIDKLVYK